MTEIVTPTPEQAGAAPSPAISVEASTSGPIVAPVQDTAAVVTETPPGAKPSPSLLTENTEEATEVKAPKAETKNETKANEPTETNQTEGSQSEEPAPLPTYEEFKAPEGVTLDAERIGNFTKTLAEFELKTKADHAEVQALGQQLVERYAAEEKKSIETYNASLLDAWEKQKNDWKESFEKDPEIGGNRKDTTINAALEFIKTHGGTEEQKKEIHQLMDQTGVGNHPAILRLFAKAMANIGEGKPLPATRPVMQKSKYEKFYGSTT